MLEKELKKYQSLNKFADKSGTVIFGGTQDKEIPLCELKQAFAPDEVLYNRSVENLCTDNALEAYRACVSGLNPDTVILHIGEKDIELFGKNEAAFENKYRELINYIRAETPDCRIAIVSIKNPDNDPETACLNKRLEYIADSEKCDFEDISTRRSFNSVGTKSVATFLHTIGFTRPLVNRRPVGDLVRILFCE